MKSWSILVALTISFIGWSGVFIWKSSFIAWNGARYFCLFDDAMISMRYAYNLAHGSGLVWNVDERVEGYSNFLLVLIMAVPSYLLDKSAAVLTVQIFGVGLMLGLAFTARGILIKVALIEDNGVHLPAAVKNLLPTLAFVLSLAYYPLNYWSLMGMETGLLALLLGLAVLLILDFVLTKSKAKLLGAALCMGLAFLTRIDSVIFLLPIGAYVLIRLRKSVTWAQIAIQTWRPFLVFSALVAGHEIFRWFYYGHWLPNTYTLKLTGMPLELRLHDGWVFVQPFLRESRYILAASFLAVALRPSGARFFLAGLGSIAIAYQVWNGGDPWNYWRIMAPGMPFLFVLGILGLGSIAEIGSLRNKVGLSCALVLFGASLIVWKVNHRFRLEIGFQKPAQYVPEHHGLVNRSLALAAVTESSATLGVFWAGTPPYYANRNAVDFLGKCDTEISHRMPDTSGKISWNGMRSVPGHNKYDLEYSIKTLRPTYVEGFGWGSQNLDLWARERYVTLVYQGIELNLLKDSPQVHWEMADTIRGLN